jgi:hypothetical protein
MLNMVASNSTPSSGFFARKIYNPLGFTKAYNFWLWVIFSGAMTGCTFPSPLTFSSIPIFKTNTT